MNNIIVASSRGKKLTSLKDEYTELYYKGGGKFHHLTSEALRLIKGRQDLHDKTYVYFVAGLPDVTRKINRDYFMNGNLRHYEEVIFKEEPTSAANRVIEAIQRAETTIKQHNAIPVFSTIIPCTLDIWNHHRLNTHVTTHLLHFSDYKHMQENLHTTIHLINQRIHVINSHNNVITPRISKTVTYKRGGHWRYRYGRLWDGTHATDKLNIKICEILKLAIEKNSSKYFENSHIRPDILSDTESSDSDSDRKRKRKWRY